LLVERYQWFAGTPWWAGCSTLSCRWPGLEARKSSSLAAFGRKAILRRGYTRVQLGFEDLSVNLNRLDIALLQNSGLCQVDGYWRK